MYIIHGHCHLIHGKPVIFVTYYISWLVQYVDRKNRRAMYQMTVTMFYIYHTLKQGFCGDFLRYFSKFLLHLTFLH